MQYIKNLRARKVDRSLLHGESFELFSAAENGSKVEEKQAILHYNKPRRREALLEIRRLIIEQGLSHTEIQLRLNIASTTYFRYLDLLFEEEQKAISGNFYTRQRLLNETLILNQRYLHIARKLIEIGDDKTVDAEQRIAAYESAASYHRASHDMAFFAPSYLRTQGLIPNPANGDRPTFVTGSNTW